MQWHCGNSKCCHVGTQGEGVTYLFWCMCLCSVLGHSGCPQQNSSKSDFRRSTSKDCVETILVKESVILSWFLIRYILLCKPGPMNIKCIKDLKVLRWPRNGWKTRTFPSQQTNWQVPVSITWHCQRPSESLGMFRFYGALSFQSLVFQMAGFCWESCSSGPGLAPSVSAVKGISR